MILIIQNFGSKPNTSCSTITDVVIIIGFLYLISFSFIYIILIVINAIYYALTATASGGTRRGLT